MNMKQLCYELDPRHEQLLEDAWSGYVWLRPRVNQHKYKGRLVFTSNFGWDILEGSKRLARKRRNHSQLITFKTHGYIYSGIDFIKIFQCDEPTQKNAATAAQLKKEMIVALKREVQEQRSLKRFGNKLRNKPAKKYPPIDPEKKLTWVWGFENKELGLKYPHIYGFKDFDMTEETTASKRVVVKRGQGRRKKIYYMPQLKIKADFFMVGKYRKAFAEYYGLDYQRLYLLAKGKIKSHRGWTLIGEPEQITIAEAQDRKRKMK